MTGVNPSSLLPDAKNIVLRTIVFEYETIPH